MERNFSKAIGIQPNRKLELTRFIFVGLVGLVLTIDLVYCFTIIYGTKYNIINAINPHLSAIHGQFIDRNLLELFAMQMSLPN